MWKGLGIGFGRNRSRGDPRGEKSVFGPVTEILENVWSCSDYVADGLGEIALSTFFLPLAAERLGFR